MNTITTTAITRDGAVSTGIAAPSVHPAPRAVSGSAVAHYRTLDTSVGSLLLVATDRGLVRVAFATQDHDRVLARLADVLGGAVVQAPARLDAAAHALQQYLTGRRPGIDLPLDQRCSPSGFRGRVLDELPRIPRGSIRSYAQVAAAAGSPRAVRAVGTACAHNPLPIVVPCHRVVRSDGSAGGYVGGPDAKAALLALERSA